MSIAARCQAAREAIATSQSEVAKRMVLHGWTNYTQMTVSRTEKGLRVPKLDESVDLAQVLHTSIEHLAGVTPANVKEAQLAEAIASAIQTLEDAGLMPEGEQP